MRHTTSTQDSRQPAHYHSPGVARRDSFHGTAPASRRSHVVCNPISPRRTAWHGSTHLLAHSLGSGGSPHCIGLLSPAAGTRRCPTAPLRCLLCARQHWSVFWEHKSRTGTAGYGNGGLRRPASYQRLAIARIWTGSLSVHRERRKQTAARPVQSRADDVASVGGGRANNRTPVLFSTSQSRAANCQLRSFVAFPRPSPTHPTMQTVRSQNTPCISFGPPLPLESVTGSPPARPPNPAATLASRGPGRPRPDQARPGRVLQPPPRRPHADLRPFLTLSPGCFHHNACPQESPRLLCSPSRGDGFA